MKIIILPNFIHSKKFLWEKPTQMLCENLPSKLIVDTNTLYVMSVDSSEG
jgi:hypothetical protein